LAAPTDFNYLTFKKTDMKTNLKNIIGIIAIAIIVVSCGGGIGGSSVNAALSQFEKAMERVEKNKNSMTEADWEAFSKELEEPIRILEDAAENNKIGMAEKIKISAVMMRYAAVLHEAAISTAAKSLNEYIEETKDNEQLQEVLNIEELQKAMQEMQNQLQNR
jgi:hypothetical protein